MEAVALITVAAVFGIAGILLLVVSRLDRRDERGG